MRQFIVVLLLLASCTYQGSGDCKIIKRKIPAYLGRPAILQAADGTLVCVDEKTYRSIKEGQSFCAEVWEE